MTAFQQLLINIELVSIVRLLFEMTINTKTVVVFYSAGHGQVTPDGIQ